MKKIEDLKKEISRNINLMKEKKELGKSYISISKKNQELKYFVAYLESSPSEKYLTSERDKLQNTITAKLEQFDHWSENVCPQDVIVSKRRALFNKELGISELRKKVKSLTYILN